MSDIHNYSEIPELHLKKLDPSKGITETVEIFNYNMSQIYKWWKNGYSSIANIEAPDVVVVHGINIKGDKGDQGEKGNSVYFINTPITAGQPVISTDHKVEDVVISNNNIYSVVLVADVVQYALIGAIGGGVFTFPDSEAVVSHAVYDWSAINNNLTSLVSPYKRTEDKLEYYRVSIGDYKKSSSLSSALYLTNILEKKNDGSDELPTDATDPTSKNFAQMVLQYRAGYNTDVATNVVFHKFFNKGDESHYIIANGSGSSISLLNEVSVTKWMLATTETTSVLDMSANTLRMFDSSDKKVLFYSNSDGTKYYLSKEVNDAQNPTLNLGMKLFAKEIHTYDMYGDATGVERDIIIKRGVVQARKLEIIHVPLNFNTTPNPLLPSDNTTSIEKEVTLGNKDAYFVWGYYGLAEKEEIPVISTDLDQAELIMRTSLTNAINDSDISYQYDRIASNGLSLYGNRKLKINVTTNPMDMVYGRKKTVYVKSYGYYRYTSGTVLNGSFWAYPIQFWDVTTGRMLQYFNGVPATKPTSNDQSNIGARVWTNQPNLPFTDEDPWEGFFNHTIYPSGTLFGDRDVSQTFINHLDLKSHACIFKVELAFFGYGWAIENITVTPAL